MASLNTRAPVPVLAVLGDTKSDRRRQFRVVENRRRRARGKTAADGLRLTKEFHLSSNYLVSASVRLENTSDKPLALPAQEWVVGTATPMDVDDN